MKAAYGALAVALVLFGCVQATRPGPLLHGATAVIVFQQPQGQQAHIDMMPHNREDANAAKAFTDLQSAVVARPSWFDQQPDLLFDLFGPALRSFPHPHPHPHPHGPHRPCHKHKGPHGKGGPHGGPHGHRGPHHGPHDGPHHGPHGPHGPHDGPRDHKEHHHHHHHEEHRHKKHHHHEHEKAHGKGHEHAHDENAAFALPDPPVFPRLSIEALNKAIEEDAKEIKSRALGQTWTIGNPALEERKEEKAERPEIVHQVETVPIEGSVGAFDVVIEDMSRPGGMAQIPWRQWAARDFMLRTGRQLPEGFGFDAEPEVGPPTPDHPPRGVDGAVVLFVLLSVACIAVWIRLLAMCLCGCGLRHSDKSYRRRCRRHRRMLRALLYGEGEKDEVKAGRKELKQPLLAPLAPEPAVVVGATPKVESAAAEAKLVPSPVNYITLQYQPLKSEEQ